MSIYRLQVAWQMDSALPTDQMIITPHFDDHGILNDPQNLCDDLAAALNSWDAVTTQLTVKAYDAQDPPPNYPLAEKIVNEGQIANANANRDVALVLSFYAEQNRPRRRGRIYVPMVVTGLSAAAARPTPTIQQKIADLVPIFAGLGGLDVDWVVYSRLDNAARKVTNWWVDNAWDTQRRRGQVATSRMIGTTGG
jgi:hypothetical protein